MFRRIRIGESHDDKDLAARVHGPGGPPFPSVTTMAAIALDFGLILVRPMTRPPLVMRKPTDRAFQQRLQPLALCAAVRSGGWSPCCGIGRRTVKPLMRSEKRPSPHSVEYSTLSAFGDSCLGRKRFQALFLPCLKLLHHRRDAQRPAPDQLRGEHRFGRKTCSSMKSVIRRLRTSARWRSAASWAVS